MPEDVAANEELVRIPTSDELARTLLRMSGILLDEESLDAVLELVATLACRAVPGVDGAGVSLQREHMVYTAASTDSEVQVLDDLQYDSGEGPCLSAIEEGRVIVAHTLDGEQRWPRFTPRARKKGIYSVLSLPLTVRERTIGALNLYSRTVGTIEDDAQETASLFAQQASFVLANARAYADAEQLTGQLQEALKSREIIGRATGIIMERNGLRGDQAFDMLRRTSQNTNTKLRDIAQRIVESGPFRHHPSGKPQ
jgi:GAF domain-containing protein